MIIAAFFGVISLAPQLICEFDGGSYETTDPWGCCTEELNEEYSFFVVQFGIDFVVSQIKFNNDPCAGTDSIANWFVDASEFGWTYDISVFTSGPRFDAEASCPAAGLPKDDGIDHTYHAYTSLLRPEEIDALAKCACGDNYFWDSSVNRGQIPCNGDYSTPDHVQINLDQEPPEGQKMPAAVDLERQIFYCDLYPYQSAHGLGCGLTSRPKASRCDPSAQQQSCASIRPGQMLPVWLVFFALWGGRMRRRVSR